MANSVSSRGALRTAADLHGKRLAAVVGTAMAEYLPRSYPDCPLQLYPSITDAIAAVKYGKADAGNLDTAGVAELLRVDPDFGAIEEVVNPLLAAAGFDKRKPELRKQFNVFLAWLLAQVRIKHVQYNKCVTQAKSWVIRRYTIVTC
jgi:ABC-type amino acid transport substrate-binding protein